MRTRTIAAIAITAAALLAMFTVATASPHEREHDSDHEHGSDHRSGRGSGRAARAIDPTYAKECGACHVAYPPRLLPAASWRRIMGDLEHHFGDDASLDADTRSHLERWLVDGAGPERSPASAEPPLRITGLSWFRHEHDEVPAGAVSRPSIRTMANCTACHSGAASWDFDEDRVKIPRQ